MGGLGTLNKVVSLFLVGGIAVIFLVAIFLVHYQSDASSGMAVAGQSIEGQGADGVASWVKNLSTGGALLGTIPLLSLAALFGVVTQGLAGALLRNPIKQWIYREPKWFVFLFRQRRFIAEVRFWAERFCEEIAGSNLEELAKRGSYVVEAGLPGEASEECSQEGAASIETSPEQSHHPMMPWLARGLFFRGVNEHTFQWVLQHYSAFYLATDSAMVLLLFFPWTLGCAVEAIVSGRPWLVPVALVGSQMVLIYACLLLAVLRYLYTARAVSRDATIALATRDSGGTQTPGATP